MVSLDLQNTFEDLKFMVLRDGGVTYQLNDIMFDKIPDLLLLRGAEGILVFLREILKRLNVLHGGKVGVLCDDTMKEREIRVMNDMNGVDWTRIRCRYSEKYTVSYSDI